MIQIYAKKYHLKIRLVSLNDTSRIIWYTDNQVVNLFYFLSSL